MTPTNKNAMPYRIALVVMRCNGRQELEIAHFKNGGESFSIPMSTPDPETAPKETFGEITQQLGQNPNGLNLTWNKTPVGGFHGGLPMRVGLSLCGLPEGSFQPEVCKRQLNWRTLFETIDGHQELCVTRPEAAFLVRIACGLLEQNWGTTEADAEA